MISNKTLQSLHPDSYRIKITQDYFRSTALSLDFETVFITSYSKNVICIGSIWTRYKSGSILEHILNKQYRGTNLK